MIVNHQIRPGRRIALPKLALASAVAAVIGLAGCGSGSNAALNRTILNQALGTLKLTKAAAPTKVTPEQIQRVVAGSTESLVIVELEETDTSAILIEIGSNGPVKTYATSARQTVSLQNGLARGSRGLGGDLMSVNFGGLPSLVAKKGNGTVSREIRVLRGDDVTLRLQFNCSVSTTRTSHSPAIYDMTESCTQTNGDQQFTNSYRIDGAGRVISSRQWFGPYLNYASIRQVRH